MNWQKGIDILPKSGLLCPKCGLEAYSLEDADYRNAIHRLCINNAIKTRQFTNEKEWLRLCRWNYERIALFFKDIK